ncbi:ESX secretion-associated protein EspG [Nocardia macrotermitis]|uniref:ESX secretion-associated protein EspG n=1 Tax=Nocardia macrotermitis TaxID=2585198 RepID=A0A7K0CYM3_9NOCA|nr:ESX secretion-associated protein EspG [Nocardia macrotermitis]MQY18579.1 hypothetical protein [Nocardia macrotermitis]
MANAWKLTQLEFLLAWQALGRDRMPYPIEYRSDVEVRADLDPDYAAAARKLADLSQDNDDLYRALETLAQPRAHVMVFGVRRDGRDRLVRMHAGIADGRSSLLVQEPGDEFDTVGDIRVYSHAGNGAIGRLVSLMPPVRPGTGHGVSINRLDLDPPETWSAADRNSPREQVVRFLRRPYQTRVEIKVDQGPALDGWQESGTYLQVVDFVDDGRYLLTVGNRLEASPLTADKLQASVQQLVDRILQEQRSAMW